MALRARDKQTGQKIWGCNQQCELQSKFSSVIRMIKSTLHTWLCLGLQQTGPAVVTSLKFLVSYHIFQCSQKQLCSSHFVAVRASFIEYFHKLPPSSSCCLEIFKYKSIHLTCGVFFLFIFRT